MVLEIANDRINKVDGGGNKSKVINVHVFSETDARKRRIDVRICILYDWKWREYKPL